MFQPQTNGGLLLGCVRLYTFEPHVPETNHRRSQRSLVNREHTFRETLPSPEHHFRTDVGGKKTSFLTSSLTCKCSTTNRIPGTSGMTQQESLVLSHKNSTNPASGYIFHQKAACVALKASLPQQEEQ